MSWIVYALAALAAHGADATITVRDSQGLLKALSEARPGVTIALAPGRYAGDLHVDGVNGSRERPVVIAAANPEDPPCFAGGNQAIHFSDCNFVTLRHVKVSGCRSNGINADDGGSFDTPSRGMVFEGVSIDNIGPQGNFDALKLSGLRDFTVRDCTLSGWGGSAIDMVGCQDGLIENNRFLGKEGYSQNSGVQAKGGSVRIAIRRNFFRNAGQRAVNIGGSTGLAFFRPDVQPYEAKDVTVEANYFVGSEAPIAFVTAVDCHVRWNTIVHPEKWVLRILQEQPIERFLPCQGGVFEDNLIVFDSRVQVFVNIGPDTRPETFSFRQNAWFDSQGGRRPSLPTPLQETDGIFQVDPKLENAESGFSTPTSDDVRLQAVGAHAWRPR